jgi:hypothetical protein
LPPLVTSEVYGVALSAPFPLLGGRPGEGRRPDILVEIGEACPVGSGHPPGTLLLEAVINGAPAYSVSRDNDGCHLRITGFGDFDLDESNGALRCRLDPSADPALLDVFLTGMVPALWLYLHDQVVLHASTVTAAGITVSMVGRSGMGKSTLAALLCGAGAILVGDDVLCVTFDDGRVQWHGRSPELRLRPAAAPIADERLPLCPKRTTADGRVAVSPPADGPDSGHLDVVMVGVPARDTTELSVRRAPGLEALSLLAAFPRLAGWRDPSVLRRQFDGLASLVNSVPVLVARVPWGPPFEAGLGTELLEAVLNAPGEPVGPNP